MGLVIRLLLAGASKSKIVAKYGQKAYNAAKNLMKTKDKSVWSKLSMKDAEKYILKPIKETTKKNYKKNLQPVKDFGKATALGTVAASVDKESNFNKGGKIKTYTKGGGVRKPNY
jgi:hypothetical protein